MLLLMSLLLGSVALSAEAFTNNHRLDNPYYKSTRASSLTSVAGQVDDKNVVEDDRRSFLQGIASSFASAMVAPMAAAAAQEPEFRQGIKVDAFNGLIFNYRGGDFNGLTVQDVGEEPSVSYAEFQKRLAAGEVEYVEFLAPDGDKAYVTFKSASAAASTSTTAKSGSSPIRIGEGYPIEKHDGYSSPMFCVRAVKNAGVPYKFVVPSLAKYSAST